MMCWSKCRCCLRIHDVDKEYYADKEDAFSMRNYFHNGKERRLLGQAT